MSLFSTLYNVQKWHRSVVAIASVAATSTAHSIFSEGEIGRQRHENVPAVYVKAHEPPTFLPTFINDEARKRRPDLFPCRVDSARFVYVLSALKQLTYNGADSASLQFCIALIMTMYNETGGRFYPLAELPSRVYNYKTRGWELEDIDNGRPYFFEPRWVGKNKDIPKVSYNTYHGLGNIPAGTHLKLAGVISDSADVAAWNNSSYPSDAPLYVREAAKNADFYKYRGRGIIQLTGRANYRVFAEPVLKKYGYNMDSLTSDELDKVFFKPTIDIEIVHNYLMRKAVSRAVIDSLQTDNPNWDAFGKLITGGPKYHYFADRCQYLYDRLIIDGFDHVLYGKEPIATEVDSTYVSYMGGQYEDMRSAN